MGYGHIEEVTQRACAAAEQGRWDLVDQFYAEREAQLASTALSDRERRHILTLDHRVEEHAQVARKALETLLRETVVQRKRMQDIRRRVGITSHDGGKIFLQA